MTLDDHRAPDPRDNRVIHTSPAMAPGGAPARLDDDRALVRLAYQDRSRWDRELTDGKATTSYEPASIATGRGLIELAGFG